MLSYSGKDNALELFKSAVTHCWMRASPELGDEGHQFRADGLAVFWTLFFESLTLLIFTVI